MAAKVWIVDDDSSIRWVLERALSAEHFECQSFEDGESLLAALDNNQSIPDVIVSDIRMPGIDGLSLLQLIQEKQPDILHHHDSRAILARLPGGVATISIPATSLFFRFADDIPLFVGFRFGLHFDQGRITAAEQFFEIGSELLVQRTERAGAAATDRLVQLGNDGFQSLDPLAQIIHLFGQEIVVLLDLAVFLDRPGSMPPIHSSCVRNFCKRAGASAETRHSLWRLYRARSPARGACRRNSASKPSRRVSRRASSTEASPALRSAACASARFWLSLCWV